MMKAAMSRGSGYPCLGQVVEAQGVINLALCSRQDMAGIEMVVEASNGDWTLQVFAAGDMVLLEFDGDGASFGQGGSLRGGEADWFDGHYAYEMRDDGSWWATFT